MIWSTATSPTTSLRCLSRPYNPPRVSRHTRQTSALTTLVSGWPSGPCLMWNLTFPSLPLVRVRIGTILVLPISIIAPDCKRSRAGCQHYFLIPPDALAVFLHHFHHDLALLRTEELAGQVGANELGF